MVVTGEDGCGTSTLLRAVLDVSAGAAVLLPQPPGEDWADSDVVGDLLPAGGPEVLTALGGGDLPLDREMWMVSGGQRQRVRLARLLAADPPPAALLLDEPLGYLDGAGVRAALALLRARADAGTAVLVVAKGDDRAFTLADRVLELVDGALAPVAP